MRIAMHFALVDQALLRGVHEFDRILDSEDVAVFVLVDVVDHRRQRGRLARTGRAGHQDQALRLLDHLAEQRRAGQVFQGQHFGRNGAEHRTGATVLVERIDTEARQRRDLEGEVDFEEFLVIAALLVRHDVVHQRMDLLVVQGWNVDPANVAVHADHRRQACGQMQVGRFVLYGKRQQLGDIHERLLPNNGFDWKDLSPGGSIAS
ncbi:hypothetical protein D3C72_1415290 [compost metagenome]